MTSVTMREDRGDAWRNAINPGEGIVAAMQKPVLVAKAGGTIVAVVSGLIQNSACGKVPRFAFRIAVCRQRIARNRVRLLDPLRRSARDI